jgi:hypothetical protein
MYLSCCFVLFNNVIRFTAQVLVLLWLISHCFLNCIAFNQYFRIKCRNIGLASENIELMFSKKIFAFHSVPIKNDKKYHL